MILSNTNSYYFNYVLSEENYQNKLGEFELHPNSDIF